jgi:hypothetical protein
MGGEGSMSSANQSLKYNRALLKRQKFKDIRNLYLQSSGKTKLEFKQVSPEELVLIKERIRIQHKKKVKREIIIFIFSIVVTIAFFYFMNWLFTI